MNESQNNNPAYSPSPARPTVTAVANQQHLTTGQWVVTLLLLSIPLVNLVLFFVWAFGSDTHPGKKNYCRASLIIFAVCIVLAILFSLIIPLLLAGFGVSPEV